MASEKKILIVAHKFLTQPDDELFSYLQGKSGIVSMHICHSFSDAPDRRSRFTLRLSGGGEKSGESSDRKKWPEPLLYLREFFLTVFWAFRLPGKWDTYIGMDGLCVFFGNFLRLIGKVRRTVFWAMDFVPENRFRESLKNRIYRYVNTCSCRKSNEMWDLSPRMLEAREKFGGLKLSDYRFHRVVPYGMWLKRIPVVGWDSCRQKTLVFMGHLIEKQGVQMVLRAIPDIRRRISGFRFRVIGGGSYRSELEKLSSELGVSDCTEFVGKIEDIRDLEASIAECALAVAPYIRELDTFTYYADPGKVKTYLACGVPVLLTDLPWNAREIESAGAGIVIPEDPAVLADTVSRLLECDLGPMRQRARTYAERFDYGTIFTVISDTLA